jgi:GlpG protein
VAVVSSLGSQPQRVAYLFFPLLSTAGPADLLMSIDSAGDLLRSFTPMLLHFGELHLVFNMVWLWYFGRQLESIHPRWLFVCLILSCSFVGNVTQYLYGGSNNFGGMSGVIYGLVGYTWLIHSFMPRSNLLISNNMFVVFVIALIVMELVASSWIASAAHVGGLISGLVFGVMVVMVYRFILNQTVINK